MKRTEVGIGMSTYYCIEVLTDSVLLIPVGLTLCGEVHSHRDTTQVEAIRRIKQGCRVNIYTIVSIGPECMLRYERYTLILVINHTNACDRVFILIELCTCKAIAESVS